jgi:hypothetical protein
MLVVLFSLSCLYRVVIHWNDNRKQVQIEQLRNEKIKQSWNYLYNNNPEMRAKMDEAYIKANR